LELWRADNPGRLLDEVHAAGLIKRYLDYALKKLEDETLKNAAIALLSLMVTPSGTRNVISEVDAMTRAREADEALSEDDLKRALDALERERLIRREVQHNANYYDIVSEFLGPWIMLLRRQREAEALQRKAARQIRVERNRVGISALGIVAILIGVIVYIVLDVQKQSLTQQLNETRQTVSRLQEEKGSADLALGLLASPQSPNQKGSRMPGLNIGEMAFAILLVYVVVGTLSGVLTEITAALLDEKARNLRRAVNDLLGSEDVGLSLRNAFWDHPLITSLRPPGRNAPTYIPPDIFSLAVTDLFESEAAGPFGNSQLRRTLSIFQRESGGEMQRYRQNVASWFVDAMGAASAAYKRRVQLRLLIIAFALTIALNADTLKMAGRLLRGPIEQASALLQFQAEVQRDSVNASAETSGSQSFAAHARDIVASNHIGNFLGWGNIEGRRSPWRIIKSNIFGWCITTLMAFFCTSLGYALARWLRALVRVPMRPLDFADVGIRRSEATLVGSYGSHAGAMNQENGK
jgi:hypothetical protein